MSVNYTIEGTTLQYILSQVVVLYTLDLYSVTCQFYLSKAVGKKEKRHQVEGVQHKLNELGRKASKALLRYDQNTKKETLKSLEKSVPGKVKNKFQSPNFEEIK